MQVEDLSNTDQVSLNDPSNSIINKHSEQAPRKKGFTASKLKFSQDKSSPNKKPREALQESIKYS
jgi:hypothetical protein